MLCPHCQDPVPEGAVYCGACGRRVIGWFGSARGGAGRPDVDASEETRKVPPDPRLLEAAGRAPAAARCMAPESNVLQRIRRGTGSVDMPSGLGAGESTRDARADLGTGLVSSQASRAPRAGLSEDTAFYLEAALAGGRSRLVVLLVADACLLLVGIYLIVSFTRQAPWRGAESPPGPHGTTGYISWEDDGLAGSIATGPVRATFHGTGPSSAMDRGSGPMSPDRPTPSARPVGRQVDPGSAQMTPSARPSPVGEIPSALPSPPARRASTQDTTAVAERLRIIGARDRFLKEIPGKVRGHQKEIRRCYQDVLTLRKGVQGDVDVEFEVAASGAVTRAKLGRNTTGSATLGSCVTGVFLGMRFSAPPGGPVVLRYPFRFTPQTR